MSLDDLRSIRRALDGDPRARQLLGERLGCVPRMVAVIARRSGYHVSDHDVADIASDVIARIWEHLPSFAGRATLETWSYRFCHNEFRNAMRRRGRGPRLLGDEVPDVAAPSIGLAEDGELASILRHVSAREGEVIRLWSVERMTMPEIAATLDVSLSTVKTCHYRALRKLKPVLDDSQSADEFRGRKA